jgi:hypothetical protein
MYKLLNKLFGWDYIHWYNGSYGGISKVEVSGDGKVFYWKYKSIGVIAVIKTPTDKEVLWLTCPSTKYFPAAPTTTISNLCE